MRSFPLQIESLMGSIAATRYGLITMDEALGAGISREAVRRRVRAGSLIEIAPRVFRVAGAPRSWQQRAMAASLWVGDNGAVARGAAGALHRLDGFPPPVAIEVSTPRTLKSNQRLLRLCRTPYWIDEDRVVIRGIGVTSIERTLIDMAGRVGEQRLEVAVEDALRRRLTEPGKIMRRLQTLPANQHGRTLLSRLLMERGAERPAESGLEVKAIRLLREEVYPRPTRQKVLDDEGRFVGRVDLVGFDRRLILEVDGFRFHSGRRAWDRDRERRNGLTALGWLVLHVTSKMLDEQREPFLRDLARAYHRPL